MAAHWSIKNYNAFVRDLRADSGVDLRTARAAYRSMSERLGRPLFAKDLERHPRISKQETQKAERQIRREDRQRAREERQREQPSKAKTINSISAWMDAYEDADEYLEIEYESTAEY